MLGHKAPLSAPFHNAANDAWYTLELLLREAEQGLKQLTSPDEEDTVEWLPTPKLPPSSPSRGTSTKSDYDHSLSIPTIEKKSTSSPHHSQTPPTSLDDTPRPHNRRRHRKRARSEDASVDDSTPAAAPADTSPPSKRRKVTHESEDTEAGAGAHGSGALVGGLRGEPNQQGKDGKEGSEGGPMVVAPGAS